MSGVWMGMAQGELQHDVMTGQPKPYRAATVLNYQMRWKVFFRDGTSLNGLPPGGLDGLEDGPGESGATPSCARYTVSDRAVSIWYDASGSPVELPRVAADQLRHGHTIYCKCESVDGLRLEGTFWDYRLFADPSHPSSCPEHAPGHGAYQIRNFSLTLACSDGRIVRRSFSQHRTAWPTSRIIFLDMVQKSRL